MNRARLLWNMALGISLIWGLILFGLTIFYSNPIRLNIVQFQYSNVIVTAELLNESEGEIRIIEVLTPMNKDLQAGDTIKLFDFDPEKVHRPLPEGDLLIPLFGFNKRYRVAPLPKEGFDGPTVVYPATESLLDKLDKEVITPQLAKLEEDEEQRKRVRKRREDRDKSPKAKSQLELPKALDP